LELRRVCSRFLSMRATFLKDTICALGHGFAILQTPPLTADAPDPKPAKDKNESRLADGHAENESQRDGSHPS
jgi:hypothetical protein